MRGAGAADRAGHIQIGRQMSELKRRLFKVVGDAGQSEASRPEPIEEIREGIAQLLKQTRERYGQSLRDVSANLRIRMAYLQAIENGRFRELPGPTYAVGFVRSYAEYLGLDAAEIVRRFKGEVEGLDNRTHLAFPEPVPEGKVPGGAIIVVSLLVLVIGYAGWYAITSRDSDGNGLIPRLSDSLSSLVGTAEPPVELAETPSASDPAAPAPSTPAPATTAPAASSSPAPGSTLAASVSQTAPAATVPESPATAVPSLVAGEGASAGLVAIPTAAPALPADAAGPNGATPETVGADPAGQEVAIGSTEEDEASSDEPPPATAEVAVPDAPAIPEAPELAAAAPAAAPAESATGPTATGPGKVVLHARLTSWVQIADASGAPILIRTLQAGESLDVPAQPGLTLFTGNAGGLEIVLDGRPLPALGPVGAVRRGISLDPDALRGGPAVE
jgi:cytoskeleton protein RodZ